MNSAERYRATYEMKSVDHLYRKEFYIWDEAIARWKTEGMPADADFGKLFGWDSDWPCMGPGAWAGASHASCRDCRMCCWSPPTSTRSSAITPGAR